MNLLNRQSGALALLLLGACLALLLSGMTGRAVPLVAANPAAAAPEAKSADMASLLALQLAAEAIQMTPSMPAPPATPTPAPTPTRAGSSAPLVAIDAGHGGAEIGAVYQDQSGLVVLEKDANLAIALHLQRLLENAGYRTVLTRSADHEVNRPPTDRNGDGVIDLQDDLQARIDVANQAGADLLFSIHNNGYPNPSVRGSEVYYCPHRPWGERNLFLAEALQAAFVRRLAEAGYPTLNRGVHDDTDFRIVNGVSRHVSLLGPAEPPRIPRPSQMPGALGESLFLSNAEGALLAEECILQAIGQAYFDAVTAYFERYPS